jgi:5-methylcytosine-specific restriction protein A
MIWMISANGKMYDHASSFATNGFIDWRQRANYNIGDIVYIYCTRPFMRAMYKCEVVKHSMPFSECVDDGVFWINRDEYEKSKAGNYARLKLLEQVDTMYLCLENLKLHGLSAAPQGPIRVSDELNAYISKHFNDYYSEGYFTDINEQETYHEGHVRSVMVDIYERSSIARGKCIEHHGSSCLICGLNFGEKYGELGEGFIHIHHLIPLHTIQKDYVVDYKRDLIPVCPNCHAMIHRIPGGESMTVPQIKNALKTPTVQPQCIEKQSPQQAKPIVEPKPSMRDLTKTPQDTINYVKHRVRHTSQKFGAGVIKAETSTTVIIAFDNGTTATFTKESFEKGFLCFTD